MSPPRPDPLRAIPAPAFPEAWLHRRLAALQSLPRAPGLADAVMSLGYLPPTESSCLGRYGDPRWLSFALGAFLADLACYPEPASQVGFERLLLVMHAFPEGFRLFYVELPELGFLPVGYTGFYPISAHVFQALEQDRPPLRARLVPPLSAFEPDGSFVYLFNYSIVAPLRGTSAAGRLVRALSSDVMAARPRGLSAITVSPDGARVASRFGMRHTGTIVQGGHEEQVFTVRFT